VVLTLSLGVPITNATTHPSAAAAIRIANASGEFSIGVVTPANVGISAVNNSTGTIVIGLGTPVTTSSASPSNGIAFTSGLTSVFDIQGVLVSVNGKTGAVIASLSASGGVNISGTTGTVQVVDAILPGLVDPTVASGSIPAGILALAGNGALTTGAAVLNSAGSAVGGKNNFTIKIMENSVDTFRSAAQFNGGGAGVFPNSSAASSVQVLVQLANIPAGLSISGCAAAMTNAAFPGNTIATLAPGTPTVSQGNFTAASPTLIVTFATPVDLVDQDTLWISCSAVGLGTAVTPLPSTAITAQATLAPDNTALCFLGAPSATSGNSACTGLTTGNIPRYQVNLQPTTALPVVVFPPSQTTMLLTFASVGGLYDTGIAVANTSTDPFTPAGGGAAPINGTITFYMYKIDGTSKVYTTTTGSPGSGLATGGVLNSGSTYLVNLSSLLTAAAYPAPFNGYIFITANFTNAHGAGTVYLTTTGDAALSSPLLVLPPVSTAQVRPTIDVGAGLGQ